MSQRAAARFAGVTRRGGKSLDRTARYFRLALVARPPEHDQLLVAWGFVAAALWAVATLAAGESLPLPAPQLFGLAALLAAIAAIDARWGLIPDELLLCVAIGGVAHAIGTTPAAAWAWAIGGVGTVFLLASAMRALAAGWLGREAFGFGDVKLLCVAALLVGLHGLLLMLPIALASALLAVALGSFRGTSEASESIPLGPHLGLGLLWAVLLGAAA